MDKALSSTGTITNTGTVAVANGVTLTETGAFLNNSGTIAATGTGTLRVTNGSYTQGNGTTSGSSTTPVQVDSGSLHYTGTGASTITQFGNATAIDGNIAASQTLTLAGRSGNYAIVNAAASWTNAGTINMTDIEPNSGNYYTLLNTTAGTFTNTGWTRTPTSSASGSSP